MNKNDDKWTSFEVHKDSSEFELPKWLDCLCKFFFLSVGFCIVFCLCGGLLWILPYRYGGVFGLVARESAIVERPWMAWARFIGGGIIGVVIVIRWWRRK